MPFCLIPHLQTYPAWLDITGAQGSRRYSSEDHRGTQASLPPWLPAGVSQRRLRVVLRKDNAIRQINN